MNNHFWNSNQCVHPLVPTGTHLWQSTPRRDAPMQGIYEKGGGGLRPKGLCTENGPTRFSLL